VDKSSIRKIVEDRVSAKTVDEFQNFCNQLCLKLYPGDYTPVRSGGPTGDMKNDGYCPKARIFFQAYGIRSDGRIAVTKKKIEADLAGCVAKHPNVKKWIFLTNQTLVGEIEAHIDLLRLKYPSVVIESWGHLKIAQTIADFDIKIVSEIIDIDLFEDLTEEQEIVILDAIFEDILETIKDKHAEYTYTTSINLDEKIQINFSLKEEQEELRDYLKYAFSKLQLINDRMAIEAPSNQDDIHAYVVGLYHKYRKAGKTNMDILVSMFDDVLPKSKKSDIHYQNLAKALILFFFDDCTIFEKTKEEKNAYTH